MSPVGRPQLTILRVATKVRQFGKCGVLFGAHRQNRSKAKNAPEREKWVLTLAEVFQEKMKMSEDAIDLWVDGWFLGFFIACLLLLPLVHQGFLKARNALQKKKICSIFGWYTNTDNILTAGYIAGRKAAGRGE